MSDVYYRIIATKGEETGKFSNGGVSPTFKKVGKIWSQRNHVMAHLSQLQQQARSKYLKCGAKIEEFVPDFQETMDITEFMELTNDQILTESLRCYFLHGEINSDAFKAMIQKDNELLEERKLYWNRKKLEVDLDKIHDLLPVHCLEEEVEAWTQHQGYTNCPDEVKAMLLLEHEGSGDTIDRWIRLFLRSKK